MMKTAVVLLFVGAALAQRQVVDDGSYDAERYELPYLHESSENSRPVAAAAPLYASASPVTPSLPRSYSAPQSNYVDPRNAAILSEARYLQADGKFGASYTQEDGVQFKEEADADGTRRGSYSYVDPTGQRKTVSYVAGKFGFQASGDHLPAAPALPAPAAPAQAPAYRAQPQPQYQPAPQYAVAEPQYEAPQPQYRAQYKAAPQPAYQPAPRPAYQPAPQPAYQPAPQPAYQPAAQPAYRPAPQYRAEPVQRLDGPGPSHPTITQSTGDSYSISAAF